LFPVLQRYNVTEPIDKLHKEHLASHEFMDAFAARVRAILASGEASDEEICTIADQCELIYHNYDQHINDENENLFPIAQSLMTADEKSEVAELMTKFREEADISPSGSPVGPVFAELMPNKPKEAP
jgi:hemerythrin-like domain-containing protein